VPGPSHDPTYLRTLTGHVQRFAEILTRRHGPELQDWLCFSPDAGTPASVT